MAQTWTIADKNYVMLTQFSNEDSNFISNDEHFISVDTPSSYYQFDCLIEHDLAKYVVVGNHVILRDKEGYIHDFTIRKITTDINNVRMTVYAENGGMDLNNESAQPFTAPNEQKSLEWYLTQPGQPLYDSPIELGLNELSDLKRVISNDSKETKLLQRLITTVNAFDGGEYRLHAKLANNNTTLPVLNLQLDIVKKLGSDISQTFLIDDYNLKELTNETSIVDLITAVFPRGKELDNGTVVDISSIVYDDGTYYTTKGSQYIKNRKAHAEWSYSRFSNDERWGYILGNFEYDTESPQELFNRALTYLKQHDSPTVAFSASGREMNAKLGDTIMIATHKTPEPIYLRARVLQMKVSYVDDNKTEYILGNFAIQPSMVSQELLNLRNQIQDNKVGYVWLRYADDREGNGISESPEGKSYMGIAYNMPSPEPSNNPSDYNWSLIKGSDGTNGTGVQASNVQYALGDSATVAPTSGWTTTVPTLQDDKYLWTRTIIYYTNGTNTVSYSVSKKGDKGEQGIQGPKGENGQDGQDGKSPIIGYLTNENFIIQTNQDGSLNSQSLAKANGYFNVYQGQTKITNGVAYSIVSQTGISVSLNTTTGYYNVNSMSAEFGTAIFKAVYNDVELQKQLMVVKNKSAIGVVVANNPPGNPLVGQLWKNTGYGNGYSYGTTYYYTGSSWQVYLFYASNIQADNLAALSANLGTVTAGTVQGKTIEMSLDNGQIAIGTNYRPSGTIDTTPGLLAYGRNGYNSAITSEGTVYEFSSGSTLYQMWMDPRGLRFVYYKSSSINGTRYFNANSNGFEFKPTTGATGIHGNTGIDLKGNISYVDFHWEIDPTVDFRTRLQQENGKFTIDSPYSNLFLKGGGEIRMLTPGVNVRNLADSAWAPVNASGFAQQSDSRYKYNIKDMPSRLEQFKDLDFKAYRLWAEDGKYQEGVIANDNIELPFINKGYDGYAVDTYAYATFIGKATQEYIVQTDSTINGLKNENAELKTKLTNLESELETIKQQLTTLLNK